MRRTPEPGDFDVSEILIRHIDQIYANLEVLRSRTVDPKTSFSAELKKKTGTSLMNFLNRYESAVNSKKSNLPKMDSSLQSFANDHMTGLTEAVVTIDNALNWVCTARQQLRCINENNQSFDLRWNNFLTIQVCQLFVTITRICLFFHLHPSCHVIVQMIQHYDKLRKQRLNIPYPDLLSLLKEITTNPFQFIKVNLKPLSEKFSSLISSVGPFLLRALGPWPIVDWEEFMIFDRLPIVNESTLPSTQKLILMNLSLIRETVLYFAFVFPKLVMTYKQFYSLMENVFNDCPLVYITRTYKATLEDVNKAFELTGNKLPYELFTNLKSGAKVKDEVSHLQRMKHIYSLLSDIIDLGLYDSTYIPRYIYDILPLAGFASYEIQASLTRSDNKVYQEVPQLLSLTIQLAKLILKMQSMLTRFFLFNLATVDLDYLNKFIASYSKSSDSWQIEMTHHFKVVSNTLLELNLEEFDQGQRYDTTALIITCGRILYRYNALQVSQKADFMQPCLEHLTVILLHLKFMNNPIKAFLEFCPLHRFWSFRDSLRTYIFEHPGGIHNYASFLTLCSLFNYDNICLTLCEAEDKENGKFFKDIRLFLLNALRSTLSRYINQNSKMYRISQQSRFLSPFDSSSFLEYQLDGQNSDAEYREGIWQLKQLVEMLPGVISTGIGDMTVTDIIAKELTEDANKLLFSEEVPENPEVIDSAFSSAIQLLWPMYALLGVSYPRKLMEYRFINSAARPPTTNKDGDFSLPSYTEMLSSIKGYDVVAAKQNLSRFGETRLIDRYIHKLIGFLSNDHTKTIYRPYGHCFENLEYVIGHYSQRNGEEAKFKNKSFVSYYLQLTDREISDLHLPYSAANFFSLDAFKALIGSLGMHAGFYLDKLLIRTAVESMVTIKSIYEKSIQNINTWYSGFKDKPLGAQSIGKNTSVLEQATKSDDIDQAAKEMVHLGVILMMRKLLRKAMADAFDKSLPGIASIVDAAFLRRTDHVTETEDFIEEIMTKRPTFKFIHDGFDNLFKKKKMQRETDPVQFCFFLSLVLVSQNFDGARFLPDNEMITSNMHLIPLSVEAMISVFDVIFGTVDAAVISAGYETYFQTLQKIKNKRDHENGASHRNTKSTSSANVLIIYADLFPKVVKSVPYGYVAEVFPFSLVTTAYRESQSEYHMCNGHQAHNKGLLKISHKSKKKR